MVLEEKMLKSMVEVAKAAAREAGEKALEEIEALEVSVKNNVELVTQADAKCQAIIISHIKERFGGHGIIAEEGENGRLYKVEPEGEAVWWVIDPIDGTNNFAHKIPLYVVSIGVICENEPVVGVIYDPCSDLMFSAVKGGKAELNGREISASDEGIDKFASIGMDSHFDGGLPGWVERLILSTRFRNLGTTALHLAMVGSGSFAASAAAEPKLWDIAAGALIALCGGAVVTDFKGRDVFPMDVAGYDGGKIEILAANKKIHRELVDLING